MSERRKQIRGRGGSESGSCARALGGSTSRVFSSIYLRRSGCCWGLGFLCAFAVQRCLYMHFHSGCSAQRAQHAPARARIVGVTVIEPANVGQFPKCECGDESKIHNISPNLRTIQLLALCMLCFGWWVVVGVCTVLCTCTAHDAARYPPMACYGHAAQSSAITAHSHAAAQVNWK